MSSSRSSDDLRPTGRSCECPVTLLDGLFLLEPGTRAFGSLFRRPSSAIPRCPDLQALLREEESPPFTILVDDDETEAVSAEPGVDIL